MAILGAVYGIAPCVRVPAQVLAALFADAANTLASVARPKPLDKPVRACLKSDEAETIAPENAEIFAWIAQQNALRDPDQSHPTVVLIDGQTAFWDAACAAIPGEHVTEILDLLHAAGYAWEAAKLMHPTEQAAQQAPRRDLEHILKGRVGRVIASLRQQAKRLTQAQRETLEHIAKDFETHHHRMAYGAYLAAGLPIATGVIEGGCRCLVKDRMARAGMRRIVSAAQSMLALHGITLSGLWDDFVAFRIREDLRRRYGQATANADSHHALAA
ncbi:hypothetical protein [Thiorhodococcus minor]|uniref:ISKra4 family transposase n=1 Tax=Thiorhodococcus minor TaxID=57489 RepID=A0A6M0K417_9GAMM|nr:hypothetical protein [Thiorhodococcus minor]NEV63994.1 hypothetical protein [Thiorhodococcus minor]